MTLFRFIKKEFLILLLLFLMLINPFFYGYRVAILFIILLFFQLNQTIKLIDKNVFYLLFFAGLYHFIAASRIDSIYTSVLAFLPDILIPSVMYIIGKGLSTKYQSNDLRIFFLFFVMFSFSFIPMISIIEQILVDGFLGVRSLYLLWNRNSLISATVLGAYFSINMASIALLNAPKSSKSQYIISIFLFILFLFSIVCILRLGNRTQLGIAVAGWLFSFFMNFRSISILNKIFQLLIISTFVGYIVYLFVSDSELIYFYKDRMGDSEYGESNLGGRLERWQLGLASLFTDPWGWNLNRFGYAHNLWLDVARMSGVLSLIPLVLFSLSSFNLFLKSIKSGELEKFLTTFISVFYISIGLMFFVEPIMDGFHLLFFVFCLFIGFLSGIISNKRLIVYNR